MTEPDLFDAHPRLTRFLAYVGLLSLFFLGLYAFAMIGAPAH